MDDSVPLLEPPSGNSSITVHKVVVAVAAGIFILFICLSLLFGILYFGSYKEEVPAWNGPKNNQTNYYSRAAVASDNVRCSEVGRNVLIEGGNAVDAAIAVMICLGVVNPMSSGLGGGHFMTIFNASTGKCTAVDARETAPYAASRNMFDNNPSEAQKGWRAVAVPGDLHGMRTEYEKFGGQVSWSRLFQPSIDMLNTGVPVSQALGAAFKEEEKNLLMEPTLSDFLDPRSKTVYKTGDIMKGRVLLRDTLKYLAEAKDPIAEFYSGEMTKLFVGEFEANDGIITYEDFKNYSSIVREESELIVTEIGNHIICGPPPPSSSAVTQSIIKIMDAYSPEFDESKVNTNVDILHIFIEASKFAYAERSKLGDIAFEKDAFKIARNVTSDAFVEAVKQKITGKSHETSYYGPSFEPFTDGGTTNIAVMDSVGNAVVVTTTINQLFGARVASESTGIIWNCQMDDFSLPKRPNSYGYPPAPANFILPGKRPLSSISPLIVINKNDKKVELAIGSAGGSTIISTVSSIVYRVMTLGWDLKTSLDAPRIHDQLVPNRTEYEPSFPQRYIKRLASKGHMMSKILGIGQATALHLDRQRLYACSDFRKGTESQPAGY